MSTYLFEHTWEEERRRLDLLQAVFDPGTRDSLGRLALPAGARCLEVGAGAGSIARWLCDKVGAGGRVVATDLDTGFLERLTEENLDVRRHDIVADELEEGHYDLVHARLVLEHIPARDRVLRRLVAALRPGGWLVVEDFDWSSVLTAPGSVAAALHTRVNEALATVFTAAGAAIDYGRRLPLDFRAAGLDAVGAEGRVHVPLGGSPAAQWWQLSLAKLREPLLGTGRLTEAEVDEALGACDDEGFCGFYPILVTAWGQRPPPETA
ncbi:MAG TPA: methyltransferase [Acidimicrobiia bacterium]